VGDSSLGYRPLYRQVRDVLVRRIADGVWQAGQALPSEPEIAADLGVSQGTVRKALDEMTTENLVMRRQGRGTFVARHDDARVLFQFFKLHADTGERQLPESKVLSVDLVRDREMAESLGQAADEPLLALERVRLLAGETCMHERICLPAALFPDLDREGIPNNLYELYATRFGVTIGRASEKLKAVAATGREAATLGIDAGHPLLRIDRLAFTVDGRPVERRVTLCRTDKIHYLSDLR
jgi:GntR family transcriptional regulator